MEKVRTAVGDEQPSSSAGKYLAGDRHLDDLFRYAKLNKELTESHGSKSIIPRRKKSDRLTDYIIAQLNEIEKDAEENPGGVADAKLDQLRKLFGVEDTLDIALKLAEFEMDRIKKAKIKNILVSKEGLNIDQFNKASTVDPVFHEIAIDNPTARMVGREVLRLGNAGQNIPVGNGMQLAFS